jgi:alpha-tubulin suppressor-like RCC1 family protein
VVALSAGNLVTVAALASGDVVSWRVDAEPQRLTAAFVQLSAGEAHTCGVTKTGTVACWGDNLRGQLGTGDTKPRTTPTQVPGLKDVRSVVAGYYHACAVTRGGEVWCWGAGAEGQLGDGQPVQSQPKPVQVAFLRDAVEVAAGSFHTCARRMGGGVVCWGAGRAGQLGDGARGSSPVLVGAKLPAPAVSLSAGMSHSCAALGDGRVVCWGSNDRGQCGTQSNADQLVPTRVAGLGAMAHVGAGAQHSCATDGSATWCWGSNTTAQLGDGTQTARHEPAAVATTQGP